MTPRPQSNDVAFDTSAVSEWKDDALRERVYDQLVATNARLVIPVLVFAELAAGHDVGANRRRHAYAGHLFDLLPPGRAVVGDDFWGVLERERWSVQREVPAMAPRVVGPFFAAVGRGERVARLDEYLAKGITFDRDRDAAKALAERGLTAEAGEVDGLVADLLAGLLAPGAFGLEELLQNARWVKRVRREPARYPAAVIAAGAMMLQALSALLPSAARSGHVDILKNPQRGDWVDLRIVASCAHASVLVTNDDQQRNRVELIARTRGTKLRATTLEQWLDRGAPEVA